MDGRGKRLRMLNSENQLARMRVTLVVLVVSGLGGIARSAPIVTYNSGNGQLTVDTTDGTLLTSMVVAGPPASSIVRWQDGTFEDNVSWTQEFFADAEQWSGTGGFGDPPVGQPAVAPGIYQIANYETGLEALDFPLDVEIGIQLDLSGNNPGDTLFVPIMIATGGIAGDFNASGLVGAGDLNLVLFNWNADGATLPPEWVNDRTAPGTAVGVDELNEVLFNWGSMALTATVPEPASASLGLVALVLGAVIRRRRV